MQTIKDWKQRDIGIARSRGGTIAVADFEDNLIRPQGGAWPPISIVQKLYKSRHAAAFDRADLDVLERGLGYYCDLQSLSSEDAVVWSYFGPLQGLSSADQATFLNWLLGRLGVDCANNACTISLWRRIPHPDTLVSGGPEIDFIIMGDSCVVLGEAKWHSPEGMNQGLDKSKGQLQLRREFLEKYGRQIFGRRQLVVLALHSGGQLEVTPDASSSSVVTSSITWSDLASYDAHPTGSEIKDYYDWKIEHTTK